MGTLRIGVDKIWDKSMLCELVFTSCALTLA